MKLKAKKQKNKKTKNKKQKTKNARGNASYQVEIGYSSLRLFRSEISASF